MNFIPAGNVTTTHNLVKQGGDVYATVLDTVPFTDDIGRNMVRLWVRRFDTTNVQTPKDYPVDCMVAVAPR